MQRRWWISFGALAVFVGLAFGSGSGNSTVEGPSSVVPVPETPAVPSPAAPATPAATEEPDRPEPPGAGEAPEGQCCCSYMEADAPVTQFFDEELCRKQGECHRDISVCVAAAKELEARKQTCCCAATERIQPVGNPCDGECYAHYVEGDTPGSCLY